MLKRILIIFLVLIALGLLIFAILFDEGLIPDYPALYLKNKEKAARNADLDAFLLQYTQDDMTAIIPSTAGDRQLVQTAIQSASSALRYPEKVEDRFVHIPIAYNGYPRPEGWNANIAIGVKAANFTRFEESVRNLVQDFSPRDPNQYQVFVDLQICNPGGTRFEQSNLLRALEDSRTKLEGLGYQVSIEQIGSSKAGYNIVAEKPASADQRSETVIEIAAHIDASANSPGASDNAAGMAGVIEMAEALSKYPNRHPWRFLVFVERGNELLGSKLHIQNIAGEPLKTVLVMDGIGWSEIEPASMNCVSINTSLPYTEEVARIFDTVREPYEIAIGWRICTADNGFSSESSYWQAGIPAVLSVGGLPYKNPTQDKCSDNMANLNLNNAFLTVKQNIAVLLTLDQEP